MSSREFGKHDGFRSCGSTRRYASSKLTSQKLPSLPPRLLAYPRSFFGYDEENMDARDPTQADKLAQLSED